MSTINSILLIPISKKTNRNSQINLSIFSFPQFDQQLHHICFKIRILYLSSVVASSIYQYFYIYLFMQYLNHQYLCVLEGIYIIYIRIKIFVYIYPLKRIIIIFSILRLCGFLFCYYSKDLIIECFFFRKINHFSIINLIIETILTILYYIIHFE